MTTFTRAHRNPVVREAAPPRRQPSHSPELDRQAGRSTREARAVHHRPLMLEDRLGSVADGPL